MDYRDQIEMLAESFDLMATGNYPGATQHSLRTIAVLNNQLFDATQNARYIKPAYKRHYLTMEEYLVVLRAHAYFDATSLSSVTAIGWNKRFEDDSDYRTILGTLVRHGKQYGVKDRKADPVCIRALATLANIVARKISPPQEQWILLAVPSSEGSLNTLPTNVADLIISVSQRRFAVAPIGAVLRTRSYGPIKNVHDLDQRLPLVKNSMQADGKTFAGRKVLILDDLLESGSTLRETARAVKAAGALEAHALAFVKTRHFAREIMN